MSRISLNELEDPIYSLDKDRLITYYRYLQRQFPELSKLQLAARFLTNQAIGTSYFEVLEILKYFEKKLALNKRIFDFILEWVRAQKVRLEYKKYLIQANYPADDLALAIDDCISRFFLRYDNYLRDVLNEQVDEYEIAALYEIFFNDYVATLSLEEILNKYNDKFPKTSTNKPLKIEIMTLRIGLSSVIVKDYVNILYSRKEDKKKKSPQSASISGTLGDYQATFRGTLLERVLKTYLIKKGTLSHKEMEKAIEQFLNSYFKFGMFYEYPEIIDVLVQSLAKDVLEGLTDNFKPLYSESYLKMLISNVLRQAPGIEQRKKLDGLAWIHDLKPVLKDFLLNFIERLLDPMNIQINQGTATFDMYKKPMLKKKVAELSTFTEQDLLKDIFDLNLDVEEFRSKLEEKLNSTKLSLIEKRNLIRIKMQEFKDLKRKLK